MPSYQDLESRVKVLEDVLGWLTHSMQIEQVVPTGMMGPDGRPTAKVVRKRYIDLYREYKNASLAAVAAAAKRIRSSGERDSTPEANAGGTEPASSPEPPAESSESFAELRERLIGEGVTKRVGRE